MKPVIIGGCGPPEAGSSPALLTKIKCRGGQYGELSGLENRRPERACEFESHPRRQNFFKKSLKMC